MSSCGNKFCFESAFLNQPNPVLDSFQLSEKTHIFLKEMPHCINIVGMKWNLYFPATITRPCQFFFGFRKKIIAFNVRYFKPSGYQCCHYCVIRGGVGWGLWKWKGDFSGSEWRITPYRQNRRPSEDTARGFFSV